MLTSYRKRQLYLHRFELLQHKSLLISSLNFLKVHESHELLRSIMDMTGPLSRGKVKEE